MLQKQTFSVQLVDGLDTKTDPKLVLPSRVIELVNGVYTKEGKVELRPGNVNLSKEVNNGEDLTEGLALANFKDEKLLFSNSKMYSFSDGISQWFEKGDINSAIVNHRSIFKNDYNQTGVDFACNQGISVYAWEENLNGRNGVRASIIDDTTGNVLLGDQQISATGSKPRVFPIGNYIFVFYRESSNLRYKRVPVFAPQFESATTIKADLNNTEPFFDVDDYEGDMIVAYHTTGNAVTLFYLTASGTVNPGTRPGEVTISERAQNCLSLYVSQADTTALVCVHNNTNGVRAFARSTVVFSFVLFAPTTLDSDTTNTYTNITSGPSEEKVGIFNSFRVFYEQQNSDKTRTLIKSNLIDVAGATGTTSVFLRSVGLASKAFLVGTKLFLNIVHESDLQSTFFTVDENGAFYGRYFPGTAGGLVSTRILSGVHLITSGCYGFATRRKNKIVTDNNTTTTLSGVNRTELDFDATNRFQSSELGENLHIIGGQLYDYDGVNLVEHGFHLYPEDITVEANNFSISVTQQGDGSNPEITAITSPPGKFITGGEYFNIWSALDATAYYVWFTVDGSGSDPAPGGKTAIGPVAALSTDTSSDVAEKVKTLIDANSDFGATVSNNVVTVTNAANGASTDAVNVDVGTGVTGTMENGTYQYAAIYKWTDNQGQIHRSAPSPAATVVISGASSDARVAILVETLRLTNKSNVVVDIFRTEDLGAIFYRRTSITSPLFSDPSVDRVVFLDTEPDANIRTSEILYTQGGIIGNEAPPSSSVLTVHRNRMWLKAEDKNVLWYSKKQVDREGVAFSPFFSKKIDPIGGDVTAIASLDSNLIIFKRSSIRIIGGEGPNAAGLNDSFTDDQEITSEVGCTNQRSIIKFDDGLMFQSDKGIYLLDRSLRTSYIGAAVETYNNETITSAVLIKGRNQIRFTTRTGRLLLFDTYFKRWSTFKNYTAEDAANFGNVYHFLKSNGELKQETPDAYMDNGSSIPMVIGTAWIKPSGVQGFQRVYWVSFIGEYLSSHQLICRVYYDYQNVVNETILWDPDNVINVNKYGEGGVYGAVTPYGGEADTTYQFRFKPKRQKCEAIRFELESSFPSGGGQGFSISDLTLVLGIKQGSYKMRAAKTLGS